MAEGREHSDEYCDATEDCAEHQEMVEKTSQGYAVLLFDGPSFPDSNVRYRTFAWVQREQLGFEDFIKGDGQHWKELGRPSIPLKHAGEALKRLEQFIREFSQEQDGRSASAAAELLKTLGR